MGLLFDSPTDLRAAMCSTEWNLPFRLTKKASRAEASLSAGHKGRHEREAQGSECLRGYLMSSSMSSGFLLVISATLSMDLDDELLKLSSCAFKTCPQPQQMGINPRVRQKSMQAPSASLLILTPKVHRIVRAPHKDLGWRIPQRRHTRPRSGPHNSAIQ